MDFRHANIKMKGMYIDYRTSAKVVVMNAVNELFLAGGKDLAVALSESNADAVLLTPTRQDHLIIVLQELALDSTGQFEFVFTAPGQLEQGSIRVLGGTRDGA